MLKNKSLLKDKTLVNGEWISAKSGETFDVLNPYDGIIVSKVPELSDLETKSAIDSAYNAFLSWKKEPHTKRAAILDKFASLLKKNANDIATLMTLEQGKPLCESLDEVSWSIAHVNYCANVSLPISGTILQQPGENKQALLIKEPFGVIGAITPWNFPVLTAIEKTVFPIAVGNCVILKPSDETPLTTLALAALLQESGLPNGVLNIVTAKNAIPIGNELTTNEKIEMISFTGSTRVGKLLYKQSADTVKKVNLELGGNSPLIVFDDADIETAATDAAILKFLNAGQVCVNLNRLFVHENVFDKFIKKFIAVTKEKKLGNGLKEGITFGPLLNQAGLNKVKSLVEDAVSKGANILHGGKTREDLGNLFYEPTILSEMTDKMEMFNEEIFGPVAPIYKFKEDKEVLKKANDTPFGLAAYVYTNSLSRAWKVTSELQVANICINSIDNYVGSPWGGHKQSGIKGGSGRQYTLEQYLETKAVAMTML